MSTHGQASGHERQRDEQGRLEPPYAAGEADTLIGFLQYQRDTLRWKTDGLDAAGLAHRVASSTMTLGGMLKHLAFVEDYWFGYRLLARRPREPFASADWAADGDWEWHSAHQDSPEDLRALWKAAVAESEAITAQVLHDGGLDQLAMGGDADDPRPIPHLRWILLHMIEEYARHNGHADLLREDIDGQTGE